MGRDSHVKGLCEETDFSRVRAIFASFSDGCGTRHSCSRSCKRRFRNNQYILRTEEIHTSMSKSGSRRTAEPNKVMYCIKLANCHMSRSCWRNVGLATCCPSSTTSSSLARFLAGIVVAVCVVGGKMWPSMLVDSEQH